VRGAYHALGIDERRRAFRPTLWKVRPGAKRIVEQVWFTGEHCNVGGGLTDSSLSDLALLWMVKKAQYHGLAFKDGAFKPRLPGDTGELEPGEEAEFTVAPDPTTLPDRSPTLLYRLMGRPCDRPIGAETGDDGGYGQNVAEIAVQLREKKPDEYYPKELISYQRGPIAPRQQRSRSPTAAEHAPSYRTG